MKQTATKTNMLDVSKYQCSSHHKVKGDLTQDINRRLNGATTMHKHPSLNTGGLLVKIAQADFKK
jgi:hypothetical protein